MASQLHLELRRWPQDFFYFNSLLQLLRRYLVPPSCRPLRYSTDLAFYFFLSFSFFTVRIFAGELIFSFFFFVSPGAAQKLVAGR